MTSSVQLDRVPAACTPLLGSAEASSGSRTHSTAHSHHSRTNTQLTVITVEHTAQHTVITEQNQLNTRGQPRRIAIMQKRNAAA